MKREGAGCKAKHISNQDVFGAILKKGSDAIVLLFTGRGAAGSCGYARRSARPRVHCHGQPLAPGQHSNGGTEGMQIDGGQARRVGNQRTAVGRGCDGPTGHSPGVHLGCAVKVVPCVGKNLQLVTARAICGEHDDCATGFVVGRSDGDQHIVSHGLVEMGERAIEGVCTRAHQARVARFGVAPKHDR